MHDRRAARLPWMLTTWGLPDMPPGKRFLASPSWQWGWTARNITAARGAESDLSLTLPLLAPVAVLAVPSAIVWWRDRRPPPGHCRKCGYDLTGNTTGLCPECGRSCA